MNLKKYFLLPLLGCAAYTMQAQKGALSPDVLREIEASYQNSASEKALRNAVVAKGMKALVLNSERGMPLDDYFSDEVKSLGITDQASSGRCWLFTGLNVLRARLISDNQTGAFFFSHNYSFFWDQLEKSNLFLQSIIDTRDKPLEDKTVDWLFSNPISDGGQFTGVSDNLMKYGVVPSEVMPETYSSNNTAEFRKILARTLRTEGIRLRKAKGKSAKALEKMKLEALKKVYKLLALNLGVPPKEFEYTLRDKTGKVISQQKWTPQEFYKRFVGENLKEDYVMLMNDPSRPLNALYEIEYDRHAYDGKNWRYVNLPIEDIKEIAIRSIKDSTMMYYSCDVGKELDAKAGTMQLDNYDYQDLLGYSFDMSKAERIQTHDSGSTHAMTLMAVDLDAQGKPRKWKVENSWGATHGAKGHLIMSDAWFDAYTFRLVVNKRYITDKVRKILDTKPTLLPPWDPMFQADK